VKEVFSQLI